MHQGSLGVKHVLDNIEEIAAAVLLVMIGLAMGSQAVARTTLDMPMAWPEIFSQFLLVWASLLGAIGALKRRVLVRMELLISLAPKRVQQGAQILSLVILGLVLTILGWKGIQLAQRTSTLAMPLPVTWAWAYAAAPTFSLLCAIRVIQVGIFKYRFDFIEGTIGANLVEASQLSGKDTEK